MLHIDIIMPKLNVFFQTEMKRFVFAERKSSAAQEMMLSLSVHNNYFKSKETPQTMVEFCFVLTNWHPTSKTEWWKPSVSLIIKDILKSGF